MSNRDRQAGDFARIIAAVFAPVAATAIGLVTNWLSSKWTWGLFAALVSLIVTTMLFALITELRGPRSRTGREATEGYDGKQSQWHEPIAQSAQVISPVRALPRDIGDFIGRGDEMKYILSQVDLRDTKAQTLAIHAVDGMAGIGKTALALHVAHKLMPSFEDSFFLNLRAHSKSQAPIDPAEALEILLVTAGVSGRQIPGSLDARAAKWRAQVAGRRTLIVLDDAMSADQIRPLLPGAPDSLVLVTSRARLDDLENAVSLTLETLDPEDAVALFSKIASQGPTRGSRSFDDEIVRDIVAKCGYLPLAIRLAAAWLRNHPARDVHDLIDELSTAIEPAAAAFELSYRDLDERDQVLFRRMVLHPGPNLTVDSVAALTDLDTGPAEAFLNTLYARHLITETTSKRYQFHDLIRAYGHTLAASQDSAADRAATIERVLAYYLRAIHRAEDAWDFGWLIQEAPNLIASTEYAVDRQIAPYAWQLPPALSFYLSVRGLYGVARGLFERALTVVTAANVTAGRADIYRAFGSLNLLAGSYPQAQAQLMTALTLYTGLTDTYGEAAVNHDLGALSCLTADYPAAKTYLANALALYQGLPGQESSAARTYLDTGWLERLVCDYPTAQRTLEMALTKYTELGDRLGQAEAHKDLGCLHLLMCQYDQAEDHLHQAQQLYISEGDQLNVAIAHRELAVAKSLTGDYPQARAHLDDAMKILVELGDQFDQGSIWHELGVLGMLTNDDQLTRSSFERAIGAFAQLGDRPAKAHTEREYAAYLMVEGELPRAESLLDDALASYEDFNDRLGQANGHKDLGTFCMVAGRYQDGIDHLERALEIYSSLDDPMGYATVHQELGVLRAASGDTELGLQVLDQALGSYKSFGDTLGAANTLVDMADVERAVRDFDAAKAHLEEAMTLFAGMGDKLGLANAERQLGSIASERGDRAGARKHWQTAREGFESIGDLENLNEVRRLLRQL